MPAHVVALLLSVIVPKTPDVLSVRIGTPVTRLVGPWRFHTGDDPRWSGIAANDASWSTMDLTAAPGAHDPDVGLTYYVPGWTSQKNFAAYSGYAWYRLHVRISAPPGMALALAGPPDVDDAYQLFFNGRLLGGSGDFSRGDPSAYGTEPKIFVLPHASGPSVIAMRVWMSAQSLGPGTGGVHIAPIAGALPGVALRYRLQWQQLVLGYVVEVAEALAFLLLLLAVSIVARFDRPNPAYHWFAPALLLTAAFRANQAFFSWTEIENAAAYNILVNVVLIPLGLGAWTMAWYRWFIPRASRLAEVSIVFLTGAYAAAQFFGLQTFVNEIRLLFLAVIVFSLAGSLMRDARAAIYDLPAVLLIGIALFSAELGELGLPGIWFPYGVGVSLTQFAYAAFDAAFALLLLRRLYCAVPACALRS